VYKLRHFSKGHIVGCGIDWDAGDVFFVRNKNTITCAEVHIHQPALERTPWYPAIGTPRW
jgi:hypothetical protein